MPPKHAVLAGRIVFHFRLQMSISFNSLVENQSLHGYAQFRCVGWPCNHYLPSPVNLFQSTAGRNLHFKPRNLLFSAFFFPPLAVVIVQSSKDLRIISPCLPTKLSLMGERSGGLWGWDHTTSDSTHALSDAEQVGHSLPSHPVSQHSGPQLPQFPWVQLTRSVSCPLSLFPSN